MTGVIGDSFRAAIDAAAPVEGLDQQAVALLSSHRSSWYDRFWAATYVWEFANSESEHDSSLIDCLEEVLQSGLTVGRDLHVFLSTCRMLAQLYFKYNKVRQASNHLLMLREHDVANAPPWVFNYSAKLQFKLDPASAVASPLVFVGFVDESARRNGGVYDSQAVAVTREFVSKAHEYFSLRSNDISQISSFVKALTPLIEKLAGQVSSEWEKLVLFYSQLEEPRVAQPRVDSPNLLQAENRMLVALLDERARVVARLNDDLTALQMRNQELEELLRGAELQSDQQRQEFVEQLRVGIGIESAEVGAAKKSFKILVLGASQITEKQMWGIAGTAGIAKEQLVLHLEYEENKRFNLDSLKYNSPFQGILLGPIAHKVVDLGDHASVLQKLQSEEGFPPVEEVRTHAGELKITKTSFREALLRMLNTIAANTPTKNLHQNSR